MNHTVVRRFGLVVLVAVLGIASFSLVGCGGKTAPDVVGMLPADAVRALEDAGYKLGETSAIATTSVEVGLVAAQEPAAGEKLKEGEAVSISVNFSNGTNAIAPTVVGLKEAEAVDVAKTTGFVSLVVDQYSDTVAEGVVAAQVPDANAKVESGSTLVIVVSQGKAPETAAVPDVVGKSTSDADSAITSAGFKVEKSEVYDSKIAKGKVITQAPEAGTNAVKGTTVQLVSSLGPGTGAAKVPNVVGQTQTNATNSLKSAGLSAKVLSAPSDTVAAGVVSQQFPAAGTTAASGSEVAIVVSSGKAPTTSVPVPDLVGMTEADATAKLLSVGLVADVKTTASSTVPVGTVGYQYPLAGQMALPATSVLVVVSSGPQ